MYRKTRGGMLSWSNVTRLVLSWSKMATKGKLKQGSGRHFFALAVGLGRLDRCDGPIKRLDFDVDSQVTPLLIPREQWCLY